MSDTIRLLMLTLLTALPMAACDDTNTAHSSDDFTAVLLREGAQLQERGDGSFNWSVEGSHTCDVAAAALEYLENPMDGVEDVEVQRRYVSDALAACEGGIEFRKMEGEGDGEGEFKGCKSPNGAVCICTPCSADSTGCRCN